MSAVKTSVPVARRRTPAPRQNSWTMVIITKRAEREAQTRTTRTARRAHTTAPPVTTPAAVGHMNWFVMLRSVDLRQASSGPTPVRNSRIKPTGVSHLLKNGAATVLRPSPSASLSVGNIVENSTKNAANSSTQLLARNAASRDVHESSSLRARSIGNR